MPYAMTLPLRRGTLRARFGVSVALLAICAANPPAVAQDSSKAHVPFVKGATYRQDVTPPAKFLGFSLGERPVRHREVQRYFELLADESKRARLFEYGKTFEGRALLLLAVSTEDHITDLDDLRASNAKLADPRTTPENSIDALIDSTPLFAWMGYTIHGDEISGTDAAVQLAYQLTAGEDDSSRTIRKKAIVLIDPLQNPDGRERFLSQIEQTTGRIPNPDSQSLQHQGFWPWGRGNHYLFDLNRDYLAATQPESKGRVATFAKWNPHLVVDAHEMGGFDTYLFSPPREPFNRHFSATMFRWSERLAAEQAKAFDRYGWPYYTREWADNWYPGYTDAFASLCGAIGMLYEQAGVEGSLLRKPDGTTVTYRQAVHNHFVSSVANLLTVSQNKEPILSDFVRLKRQSCEGRLWPTIGVPHRNPEDSASCYLTIPDGSGRVWALVDLLNLQGIEVHITREPVRVPRLHGSLGDRLDDVELPVGTVVVNLNQPRGSLARAILGFDPRMTDAYVEEERRSLEQGQGSRLYDITSWSIPLAFHLKAFWSETSVPVDLDRIRSRPAPREGVINRNAPHGFALSWVEEKAPGTLVRLFEEGLLVRCALRPFKVGGSVFPRGTLVLPRVGNPEDLASRLDRISREIHVVFVGISSGFASEGPDLGGRHFGLLSAPRVGLLAGSPVSPTDYGALWHLLDEQLGLRVSSLPATLFNHIDLDKYNTLVVPSISRDGGIDQLLGESGMKRLKRWVEGGGTLIALGGSAGALAQSSSEITRVKLRRSVLDKLDEIEEERSRERKASSKTKVDFDALWSGGQTVAKNGGEEDQDPEVSTADPSKTDPSKAVASKTDAPKKQSKVDKDKRKRQDEWERRFSPSGTFLRAHLDRDHWLTAGLTHIDSADDKRTPLQGKVERIAEKPADFPVLVSSSQVFLTQRPVQTPVRLSTADRLRVSGLLWPEAARRLADSAYLTRESRGKGQVILFRNNPVRRAMLLGTRRLLLNAILLGPGLGTNRAAPW